MLACFAFLTALNHRELAEERKMLTEIARLTFVLHASNALIGAQSAAIRACIPTGQYPDYLCTATLEQVEERAAEAKAASQPNGDAK